MTSGWTKVKLEDVTKLISRGITPKYTEKSKYFVLNQKCIRNGTISYGEAKLIDVSAKNINQAKFIKETDTLICSTGVGTLGRVGKFKKNYRSNTTVDSHVTIVRGNENINSIFLSYNLFGRQHEIESLAEGTTGQIELPRKKLGKLIIYLPPLSTQQKIAKVLSAIDDKIELNNKINENLEQQAQAMFKSWFIDFEPFGGKMPDDWQEKRLLDIANYTNGLAMQKFRPLEGEKGLPVLKIRELRQGFCDINSESCSSSIKNEYIVHDGDVIFSWSGSLLIDFWCSDICGLNQHLFKITSKKFDKWFYYSWTHHHLEHFISIAEDKATTMGHIKREDLGKAKVIVPSFTCYQYIGSLISPLYELIIKNRIENHRLSQLRDTLLPKLMSGEIDVSKVNIDDFKNEIFGGKSD